MKNIQYILCTIYIISAYRYSAGGKHCFNVVLELALVLVLPTTFWCCKVVISS